MQFGQLYLISVLVGHPDDGSKNERNALVKIKLQHREVGRAKDLSAPPPIN